MAARAFVKSAGTKVPVGNSQAELQRLLKRYGAGGFGVSEDYEQGLFRVFFRVPDAEGGVMIPVRLEVRLEAVLVALYGPLENGQHWTDSGKEQGARVAWRQLVLWVDAALCASAAGLQKISEAFLAHTLVRGENGQAMRLVDRMDQEANGNWRALLPPGAP